MMQPLAVVLCGGLFVGTFLTLLFIPTLYASFDVRDEKRKAKRLLKVCREIADNFDEDYIDSIHTDDEEED